MVGGCVLVQYSLTRTRTVHTVLVRVQYCTVTPYCMCERCKVPTGLNSKVYIQKKMKYPYTHVVYFPVSFSGKGFLGWQRQTSERLKPSSCPAVQTLLEESLERVLARQGIRRKTNGSVLAFSRLDAGVHARAFPAYFLTTDEETARVLVDGGLGAALEEEARAWLNQAAEAAAAESGAEKVSASIRTRAPPSGAAGAAGAAATAVAATEAEAEAETTSSKKQKSKRKAKKRGRASQARAAAAASRTLFVGPAALVRAEPRAPRQLVPVWKRYTYFVRQGPYIIPGASAKQQRTIHEGLFSRLRHIGHGRLAL